MPVSRSSAKLDSLTSLRGLLAIWVVFYHYTNELVVLSPSFAIATSLLTSGYLAVPGFFILSGYVLAYTYAERFAIFPPRGLLRFWLMRIGRIYPVHAVTLFAVLAMVLVGKSIGIEPNDPSGYTVRSFAMNVLLIQTWVHTFHLNWNYPSWSISSEWFAYLIFPFAATVLPLLHTRLRLCLGVGIGVSCSAAVYSINTFPFRELICVLPTFFSGMILHQLVKQRASTSETRIRNLPEVILLTIVQSKLRQAPQAS